MERVIYPQNQFGRRVCWWCRSQWIFADFNGDAKQDLFIGIGSTLAGQPDKFFLGNGDGTFTDESNRMPNMPSQPSNGSVACDYDNDGDLDIFVATYSISTANGVNALWENNEGSFTNVAFGRGFASQATGNPFGSASANGAVEPGRDALTYTGNNGFGLDCDDINNDGNLDIFMTAISHPDSGRQWGDPTLILINQGQESGYNFIAENTERNYPFNEGDVDGATIDFDNDGRMDFRFRAKKSTKRTIKTSTKRLISVSCINRATAAWSTLDPTAVSHR